MHITVYVLHHRRLLQATEYLEFIKESKYFSTSFLKKKKTILFKGYVHFQNIKFLKMYSSPMSSKMFMSFCLKSQRN